MDYLYSGLGVTAMSALGKELFFFSFLFFPPPCCFSRGAGRIGEGHVPIESGL